MIVLCNTLKCVLICGQLEASAWYPASLSVAGRSWKLQIHPPWVPNLSRSPTEPWINFGYLILMPMEIDGCGTRLPKRCVGSPRPDPFCDCIAASCANDPHDIIVISAAAGSCREYYTMVGKEKGIFTVALAFGTIP